MSTVPGCKHCTYKTTEILRYYLKERNSPTRPLFGVSPQVADDVHSFTRRRSFELSGLKAEVACVERFRPDFERNAGGASALALTLTSGGKSRRGHEHGDAGRRGMKKRTVRGVDVVVKAEGIKISLSSSSSSSSSNSRKSSSLSSQGSSSSSSDRVAGAEHSSTGAHRRITHIGVIRQCVIDVEGWDISTRNAGQLSPLHLTSQVFRVYNSRTTTVFLPT